MSIFRPKVELDTLPPSISDAAINVVDISISQSSSLALSIQNDDSTNTISISRVAITMLPGAVVSEDSPPRCTTLPDVSFDPPISVAPGAIASIPNLIPIFDADFSTEVDYIYEVNADIYYGETSSTSVSIMSAVTVDTTVGDPRKPSIIAVSVLATSPDPLPPNNVGDQEVKLTLTVLNTDPDNALELKDLSITGLEGSPDCTNLPLSPDGSVAVSIPAGGTATFENFSPEFESDFEEGVLYFYEATVEITYGADSDTITDTINTSVTVLVEGIGESVSISK